MLAKWLLSHEIAIWGKRMWRSQSTVLYFIEISHIVLLIIERLLPQASTLCLVMAAWVTLTFGAAPRSSGLSPRIVDQRHCELPRLGMA